MTNEDTPVELEKKSCKVSVVFTTGESVTSFICENFSQDSHVIHLKNVMWGGRVVPLVIIPLTSIDYAVWDEA